MPIVGTSPAIHVPAAPSGGSFSGAFVYASSAFYSAPGAISLSYTAYDTDGYWSGTQLVLPVTAYYLVGYYVDLNNRLGDGSNVYVDIRLYGTWNDPLGLDLKWGIELPTGSSDVFSAALSEPFAGTAGETIYPYLNAFNGGATTLTVNDFALWIYKLGS